MLFNQNKIVSLLLFKYWSNTLCRTRVQVSKDIVCYHKVIKIINLVKLFSWKVSQLNKKNIICSHSYKLLRIQRHTFMQRLYYGTEYHPRPHILNTASQLSNPIPKSPSHISKGKKLHLGIQPMDSSATKRLIMLADNNNYILQETFSILCLTQGADENHRDSKWRHQNIVFHSKECFINILFYCHTAANCLQMQSANYQLIYSEQSRDINPVTNSS